MDISCCHLYNLKEDLTMAPTSFGSVSLINQWEFVGLQKILFPFCYLSNLWRNLSIWTSSSLRRFHFPQCFGWWLGLHCSQDAVLPFFLVFSHRFHLTLSFPSWTNAWCSYPRSHKIVGLCSCWFKEADHCIGLNLSWQSESFQTLHSIVIN